MKTMKRIFVLMVTVLSLISCTKIIPVNEDYQDPAIVLNSTFDINDEVLSVFVTESQRIYGYHQHYRMVDDADIALFKDGQKVGDFVLGNDYIVRPEYDPGYGAKYNLAVGSLDANAKYAISFEHATMGKAFAETSFPSSFTVDSVSFSVEQVMDYDVLINVLVANVSFTDQAGEDNYYQLIDGIYSKGDMHMYFYYDSITGMYVQSEPDSIFISSYSMASNCYEQIDPLIKPNEDDLFSYTENQFMVFNDDLIDGKSYTLKVVLIYGCGEDYLEQMDTTKGEFCSCNIELRTISKDLYLYYRSVDDFYWNDGSLFAEPVQIYSNVDNGLGIVSGYQKVFAKGTYGSDHKAGIGYVTHENFYY